MAEPTSAAAQSSGGLPQFDPAPWAGEIVWSLAIFLALYLLLARVILPRLAGTIAEREDRIAGDIREARRARDAAQGDLDAASAELAAARLRAQRIAQDAQETAKASAALQRAREEAKLAKNLETATARIGAARDEAMSHVRSIASDTAEAIIAHFTGETPPRADIDGAMASISDAR
jgi:F-type H+-transporting ATPase subunit b